MEGEPIIPLERSDTRWRFFATTSRDFLFGYMPRALPVLVFASAATSIWLEGLRREALERTIALSGIFALGFSLMLLLNAAIMALWFYKPKQPRNR